MTTSEQTNDKIITFPDGVLGFPECRKFTLHQEKAGDNTLFHLRSQDKSGLGFYVIDPAAYGLKYDLTLSDAEQKLIKAQSPEDVAIFLMLARGEGAEGASRENLLANIGGPIIINIHERIGLQKVLTKVDYSVSLQGE